jgi:ankyrin repeat protein
VKQNCFERGTGERYPGTTIPAPLQRTFTVLPRLASFLLIFLSTALPAAAQIPPSASELQAYRGLHAAAAKGDATEIEKLVKSGAPIDARDGRARTPLHVAAFMQKPEAAQILMRLGADANALEAQKYDIVTIAAVADDLPTLKVALEGGCKAGNITSPYYGTALIAAAHLGHDEVVRTLIAAKAPLDHVNNLGWTAVIESIVLGDGGKRHVATLKALVDAGANVNLADRSGETPLTLAKRRGFKDMVAILEKAGGR